VARPEGRGSLVPLEAFSTTLTTTVTPKAPVCHDHATAHGCTATSCPKAACKQGGQYIGTPLHSGAGARCKAGHGPNSAAKGVGPYGLPAAGEQAGHQVLLDFLQCSLTLAYPPSSNLTQHAGAGVIALGSVLFTTKKRGCLQVHVTSVAWPSTKRACMHDGEQPRSSNLRAVP
jgi:hypothetical protein